jgi:ferritin
MKKLLTSQEVEMINKLGVEELTASQTYLHLSNTMKTIGFFGAEKFFMNESNSEREHYNKLEAFMNDMNEQIEVRTLQAVNIEIDDLMEAFEHALEMETNLLGQYEEAYKKSSPKLQALIHHFLELQVESVGEYGDLIARLSRTNEPILIDQELGK